MPRPVRSHPESPVRRIQKRPIAGAVDAGPQATAAWRDRQRVHGPATRCCRTQAENQSLLDHGSQRSAFPSGLRTSLGEQLVTNVNCCLHHNHRTTHSTEVYAVFSPGRVQRHVPPHPDPTLPRPRWGHDLEMPAGIGRCGQGRAAGGAGCRGSRRSAPGRTGPVNLTPIVVERHPRRTLRVTAAPMEWHHPAFYTEFPRDRQGVLPSCNAPEPKASSTGRALVLEMPHRHVGLQLGGDIAALSAAWEAAP